MSYSIRRKCEDALEKVIRDVAPQILENISLFKGCSFSELTTPRVTLVAEISRPHIVGSRELGNWHVEISGAVITHKDDASRETHGLRVEAMEEVFLRSDIVDLLNAAGIEEFRAFEFTPGDGRDSILGNEVKSENTAIIYCAPSAGDPA